MSDKVTPIYQEYENPEGINPLIADNPKDTMDRVASVLTYLSVLQHDSEGVPVEGAWDKWRHGRSLIYQTMIHALIVQSTKRNPPS
ncbi:MAG: hypothetical protein PVJ66_03520 [Gammaproteobacteria bacterium]|jgi:hypothetical protein